MNSDERKQYEALMEKYPTTREEDVQLANYWRQKERERKGNYPAFAGYETLQLFTYTQGDRLADSEMFAHNQWIEHLSEMINVPKSDIEGLGGFLSAVVAMLGRGKVNIRNPNRSTKKVTPTAVGSHVQGASEGPLKGGGRSGKGGIQAETKPSSGAENTATYPKLKDDLVQQNLNHIAKQDPRLDAVVKGDNGKLNYGVGSGTRAEADRLGQIWVGDGAKLVGNQKDCPGCLISADELRIYRPPSEKPNSPAHLNPTGIQANFVQQKDGKITGNAHMSIKK